VETLTAGLTRDNLALAVEIASLPETVRGYGHLKAKSAGAARAKRDELLARYRAAPVRAAA
jgi:indolepyruvate ferredoxin oxidoreductase